MAILTLSGSSRSLSSNARLLRSLPPLFPDSGFEAYTRLDQLPLFRADHDRHPWPEEVLHWRERAAAADALIVCTPEYLHNIPAALKNALEWVSSSGELNDKAVLAMTLTPHPPRGEKAMQSLIWSLQALDARIVGQLPVYQNELKEEGDILLPNEELLEVLGESIDLL